MQRDTNVKVKEAITALCKLLSALDVESVPPAEVFRRAKFNKTEATQDLWQLLSSIFRKAFARDCACPEPTVHSDLDAELWFVKSALWHSGYGGWWVVDPQACRSREEIGSRDLLLALSWSLASGTLLVVLLREKILQLEVLTSAAGDLYRGLALEVSERGEEGAAIKGDLRTLQWQYGKMKLLWRSLIAAQQEQAKLIHEVFNMSLSSTPPSSESSSKDVHLTGCTALDKDLARIQSLNGILKLYLEWNNLEPLFWCWMDSVIDCYLSDGCRGGFAEMPLSEQAVIRSCSINDKTTRSVRRLDKMLLRIQTELQHKQAEQATCADTSQNGGSAGIRLSDEQKAEVERRVAVQLQSLSVAHTPTTTAQEFTPYFQEKQASGSTLKSKPKTDSSGTLQAATLLKTLRERKAMLEWELELLRQSQRETIQSRVSKLNGMVLIQPH